MQLPDNLGTFAIINLGNGSFSCNLEIVSGFKKYNVITKFNCMVGKHFDSSTSECFILKWNRTRLTCWNDIPGHILETKANKHKCFKPTLFVCSLLLTSLEPLMLTAFTMCELLYSIKDLPSMRRILSIFAAKIRSASAFTLMFVVLGPPPPGGVGGSCFGRDILCCGCAQGSYAGTSSTSCMKTMGWNSADWVKKKSWSTFFSPLCCFITTKITAAYGPFTSTS